MWAAYTTDLMTGQLEKFIDIPSFSWTVTVNDSSMSTTKKKEVGLDDVTGITLPWEAIPGDTPQEKFESIESGRKGLALFWRTDEDVRSGSLGRPILWGGIGERESDWDSTSFSLESVYSIMANRYCFREGDFKDGKSRGYLYYNKLSMRGIASEVGYTCTEQKPGGALPVDWQYRGELHQPAEGNVHERTYEAWNVNNLSGKDIFDKLSQVDDGVDMQWRPYLTEDGSHVRMLFVAGSDADKYLGQNTVYQFSCFNGGGTMENIKVSYALPYERVLGTGAGSDSTTTTAIAEDLSLVQLASNPYSLREYAFSDTNVEDANLLKQQANGVLSSLRTPYMQISGDYWLDDAGAPQLGTIWPGEVAQLSLYGYPDLPDGVYQMRIMEMSGDSSSRVHVLFDITPVPYFQGA